MYMYLEITIGDDEYSVQLDKSDVETLEIDGDNFSGFIQMEDLSKAVGVIKEAMSGDTSLHVFVDGTSVVVDELDINIYIEFSKDYRTKAIGIIEESLKIVDRVKPARGQSQTIQE